MDDKLPACTILLIVAALAGGGESRTEAQDREVKSALMNMIRVSRPYRLPPTPFGGNSSATGVTVKVSFQITAVTDVNVKKGFVELEGYFQNHWNDPRLQYDLPDDGGRHINWVRVNPKSIWTPDLELFNAVFPGVQTVNGLPLALVQGNGDVMYIKHVKARSSCDVIGQLSSSSSPGEGLNCTMKFGSWTYHGFDVQLTLDPSFGDGLSEFRLSGAWNATSATAWISIVTYPCCPEIYPNIQFSYILKKRGAV